MEIRFLPTQGGLARRIPGRAGFGRENFTIMGKFARKDLRFARRPVALHAPWDDQTPRTPSV